MFYDIPRIVSIIVPSICLCSFLLVCRTNAITVNRAEAFNFVTKILEKADTERQHETDEKYKLHFSVMLSRKLL